MKLRTCGRLDFKPSALGFGAMRLPTIGDDPANIDTPKAEAMIRYALDHGVNYIDTAYAYHGGASETFLGKLLQGADRHRAKIATKLPAWKVETADDFDRVFDEQLTRLDRDAVDFYLLHALNEKSWTKLRDLGVLPWAERQMAHGRIAHLGFSFHDKLHVFKDIVNAYEGWSLCQIQYNYVDVEHQAGRAGLHYAAQRGLGVVIMEPLRGGQLAKEPPPQVATLWNEADRPWSHVAWSLHWLWDQAEVSLVLSGMSNLAQVKENVVEAGRSGPGILTDEERALLARIREAFRAQRPVPCTGCGYCLPCPSGVAIPRVFEQYNNAVVFDDLRRGKLGYRMMDASKRADRCTACQACEAQCPQGITVSSWMPKIHDHLATE